MSGKNRELTDYQTLIRDRTIIKLDRKLGEIREYRIKGKLDSRYNHLLGNYGLMVGNLSKNGLEDLAEDYERKLEALKKDIEENTEFGIKAISEIEKRKDDIRNKKINNHRNETYKTPAYEIPTYALHYDKIGELYFQRIR